MRVLWIVNVPLQEARQLWNLGIGGSGGWMDGALQGIAEQSGAQEIIIAFPLDEGGEEREGNRNTYYTIPARTRWSNLPSAVPPLQRRIRHRREALLGIVKPDLVHLWGTEAVHALPTVQACRRLGVPAVLSIQGLVGPCGRHFLAGLPRDVQAARHWADPLFPLSPRAQAQAFTRMKRTEESCLRNVDLLLGRTSWDRAAARAAGSRVPYLHCDEILRAPFWHEPWTLECAQPGRIFVSQGSVPIKGLHVLLEALAQIRQDMPEASLVIAGRNPFTTRGPYARYLRRLIQRWGLSGSVECVGLLSADQMAEQMRTAQVFALPSIIENSPNSLGEAMLMGMPCVASYVGGVPDMLTHDVDGKLYQADAPYMLAFQLSMLMGDPEGAAMIGNRARVRARVRHEPTRNTEALLGAYRSLTGV